MKNINKLALAMVSGLLLLSIVGCGGSPTPGPSGSPSASGTAAPAATPAKTP